MVLKLSSARTQNPASLYFWSFIENPYHRHSLIKETQDFTTNILPPGLLVIHDASRSCQHNVAKLHAEILHFTH